MKYAILYCGIAAVLVFIISFITMGSIFDFLLSFFNDSHLSFQVSEVNTTGLLVKLCISLALVPLFMLVAWLFGSITSLKKRVYSLAVILICIVAALALNNFRVLAKDVAVINPMYKINYPLDNLHFDYAVILGAFIGTFLGFFIFKTKGK